MRENHLTAHGLSRHHVPAVTPPAEALSGASGSFQEGLAVLRAPTDDAVGEVWEGIQPSSVGKLREAQVAAILLGRERPPMFPEWLKFAPPIETSPLSGYLVIENGKTKITGRFADSNIDDPVIGKIQRLRDQANRFVAMNCPRKAKLTECSSRFLSEDYIEWLISWRSTRDGKLEAIELLHERRMAGLGSTWNIVFGN